MSFIEKRNRKRISEIFEELIILDKKIIELISQHSIKVVNDVATKCAKLNKKINEILKLYPEIKVMDDKIEIKSSLQFYYDLIDKLTDFIKHIENFESLHQDYYDAICNFINKREKLIAKKYKPIATQELIAFYDKKTRQILDDILASKITKGEHEYFTFGSLEQEIKKIGKVAGADLISIKSVKSIKNLKYFEPVQMITSAKTVISFAVVYSENTLKRFLIRNIDDYNKYLDKNLKKLTNITKELTNYLKSKGYKVQNFKQLTNAQDYSKEIVEKIMKELDLLRTFLADGKPITNQHQFFINSLITDADLLSDS
ncbi:MAG: hypothetical protein ACTSQJ_15705 [Promethearchaeota archaeon]